MIVDLIEAFYRLLWGDLFTLPVAGGIGISFMVVLLFAAGIGFTLRTRLLPVRLFRDMIGAVCEKKQAAGGLSSFQTLVISTATKNQFLACQFAIMGTFMPALMLSGFLYDILNMPPAVRAITYLIPARYYVTLLQTLFLAGDIPSVIIPCCITLGVFAVVLMGIARMKAPKSLE